jgi:hypothetical protein
MRSHQIAQGFQQFVGDLSVGVTKFVDKHRQQLHFTLWRIYQQQHGRMNGLHFVRFQPMLQLLGQVIAKIAVKAF